MIQLEFIPKPPGGIMALRLRRAAAAAERLANIELDGDVTVKFVNQAASRYYNQTYAKHDYPTDVLSFAYTEDKTPSPSGEVSLGDIIICTPIAVAHAKQYRIPLEAEVTLLLAHGLLHIAGYDHQNPATKASFAQIQNAIMKELGIPAREYFNDHHN